MRRLLKQYAESHLKYLALDEITRHREIEVLDATIARGDVGSTSLRRLQFLKIDRRDPALEHAKEVLNNWFGRPVFGSIDVDEIGKREGEPGYAYQTS